MSGTNFRILPQPHAQTAYEDSERARLTTKWITITAFALPGLILFVLFVLWPLVQSAFISTYRWDGFGPIENYVGLDNYKRLWDLQTFFNLGEGNIFRDTIIHALSIVFMSLVVQLPLALSLALIVGRGELPGRRVFRLILFVPYVFSEILTAVIFDFVLHQDGMVNTVLGSLFANYNHIGWLSQRNIVLFSVFMVLTWKYFGFHMILYMAGLQNVPQDLEDAARVDGATERQVLRNVTLPLLSPTIRLTIFLSVLGSLQQFELVWVLTQGGPSNASELMGTFLYKFGIQRNRLGYGSAIAVSLFVITLAFSLTYQWFAMRRDFDTA